MQRGSSAESSQSGWNNVGETDRYLSLAAGAALVTCGLTNKSYGLLCALTGGYLVFKGLTGHCEMYRAMGIRTT